MRSSCEEYLKLLGEFESLPKEISSESIFDIVGYPHYENVASNILRNRGQTTLFSNSVRLNERIA